MVLEGYFYVGTSLHILHGFNVSGARAVFILDVCRLFPQCMLSIFLLIRGVNGVVVTRAALDIEQGLLFALWLSLPCQWQGLFPSCSV